MNQQIAHPDEDFIHHYRGDWNGQAWCRIRVYGSPPRPTIVIATELPDNTGTSITNFAEYLATEMYHRLGQPEPFLWVEHYPETAFRTGTHEETFDLVEFEVMQGRFHSPRWKHLTRPQVDALIGGSVGS